MFKSRKTETRARKGRCPPLIVQKANGCRKRLDSFYGAGVIFVYFVLYTSYVIASTPAGPAPKDAQQAFDWSDAVFVGKVLEVEKDQFGYNSIAKVQIAKVWKGKEFPREVHVDGTGGPSYPARLFMSGRSYLFYVDYSKRNTRKNYHHRLKQNEGFYPGGLLRADSFLHRVIPISRAADDLKFLSEKSSYNP